MLQRCCTSLCCCEHQSLAIAAAGDVGESGHGAVIPPALWARLSRDAYSYRQPVSATAEVECVVNE